MLTPVVFSGGSIDFESIPNSIPTEGLTISGQFAGTWGVTFSLANGASPVLAKVGAPQTAFQGFQALPDQPAPGSNAGQYFLTDDGVVAGPPADLIVCYATPVHGASGILLDIDGNEAWTIEALDEHGTVVAELQLGPNNEVDGSATPWSFSSASHQIWSIRFAYTGSQSGGVGLAFDNFSPSEPFCPADLNADGLVDGADLAVLLGAWGSPGLADFDSSGSVDGADLGTLLGAWGACPN